MIFIYFSVETRHFFRLIYFVHWILTFQSVWKERFVIFIRSENLRKNNETDPVILIITFFLITPLELLHAME